MYSSIKFEPSSQQVKRLENKTIIEELLKILIPLKNLASLRYPVPLIKLHDLLPIPESTIMR